MEEEKKEGSEGGDAKSDQEQKATFTAEEVAALKKQISESEKGVQKVISEKKTFERAIKEIGKVAENNAYLVELHAKSPETAKIILDEYYDGESIDAFKARIGYQEDLTDPEVLERKISEEAKKRLEAKEISDGKDEFVKKLGMDESERKAFEEAFEERTQLKSFRVSDLQKHLEKAYREVRDESDTEREARKAAAVASTHATGEGKSSGKESKSKLDEEREKARAFLAKFNP